MIQQQRATLAGARLLLLAGLALTLAASPAWAARQVMSPSGRPDALFPATALADGMSKVATHCLNKGFAITSQTANQIVCEIPVGGLTAGLQQFLIGNSYSTTPRSYVRVTLVQVGEDVRAQANAWVETQMAFGQVRQVPYNNDSWLDNLQGFLLAAGAQYLPGTRITGLLIGYQGQIVTEGKRNVIPVSRVIAGTPAATAGIKVGDRIIALNGAPVRTPQDLGRRFQKIVIGTTYPVVIERDGQQQTLMFQALEYPLVGTPEWDAVEHPQADEVAGAVTTAAAQ